MLARSHVASNPRSFARSLEGASFTSSFASATISSVVTMISSVVTMIPSAGGISGATSFAAFSICTTSLPVGRESSAPPDLYVHTLSMTCTAGIRMSHMHHLLRLLGINLSPPAARGSPSLYSPSCREGGCSRKLKGLEGQKRFGSVCEGNKYHVLLQAGGRLGRWARRSKVRKS